MQAVHAPIVRRLHLEVARAISSTDVRARLLNLGLQPIGNSPEALSRMTQLGTQKWGKVITDSAIRPD